MIPHCSFDFISLIVRDIEHLFLCLLASRMSLEKYLSLLPIFYCFFLVLSCMHYLYILETNLSVESFANVFSQL